MHNYVTNMPDKFVWCSMYWKYRYSDYLHILPMVFVLRIMDLDKFYCTTILGESGVKHPHRKITLWPPK